MGRKKKDTFGDYQAAELAAAERTEEEQNLVDTSTSEEDGIEEALELNRHPHSMDDEEEQGEDQVEGFTEEGNFVTEEYPQSVNGEWVSNDETEKTNEVKCPNVNCTLHLKFEEGSKCINCGFTFTEENMAEFEEKDLHEESNEEFIEGVSETPRKLTPKERERKIFDLELRVAKAKVRVNELETIAELAKSNGLVALLTEVKSAIHKDVDRNAIKEEKIGIKSQEAIILVADLVSDFSTQYNGSKRDIKSWESDIEELKQGQLSLLDAVNEVDDNSPLTIETKALLEGYGIDLTNIKTEFEGQVAVNEVIKAGEELLAANTLANATEDGSDVLDEAIENAVEETSAA